MRDGANFELYTTSIDGSLIRKWGNENLDALFWENKNDFKITIYRNNKFGLTYRNQEKSHIYIFLTHILILYRSNND